MAEDIFVDPRIVILGCAGTGKTTFSRRLGEVTGAPVICLDAIWQPEWSEKDVPYFRSLLQEAHASERWISDGNFALATFDIRLPRATLILWLEESKSTCAWRAIKRVFTRQEPHRLGRLANVLAFIWRFDRINRPRIEAQIEIHGPNVPVRRLRTSRQCTAFLSDLEAT